MKSDELVQHYKKYLQSKNNKEKESEEQIILFGEDQFNLDLNNNIVHLEDLGAIKIDNIKEKTTKIELVVLIQLKGGQYQVFLLGDINPYTKEFNSIIGKKINHKKPIPYKIIKELLNLDK